MITMKSFKLHVIAFTICIIPIFCFRDPILCDLYYLGRTKSGLLTHPNYPFNYTENRKCLYRIYLPDTLSNVQSRLCFTFRKFQLAHVDGCFDDYLEFEGIGKYCGNGTLNGRASTLNPLSNVFSNLFCIPVTKNRGHAYDIRFSSRDFSSNLGFYAEFTLKEESMTKRQVSSNVAPCESSRFTCFNRNCIPFDNVCDGTDDCGDASDESYWHARCPGAQNIRACDFESDTCHFEGYGWTRANSSHVQSPSYDNTLRTSDGNFLYADIEGVDRAYVKYTLAPLEYSSADVHSFSDPSYCLSFWYYMSASIGRLSLYANGNSMNRSLVWFRDGYQGNSWIKAEVRIESKFFPISEVSFEYKRNGISDENSVAIDDISLTGGMCIGDDLSCSFEIGFCGWRSFVTTIPELLAVWEQMRGPTSPTHSYGPKADRFGGYGSYIFMDASKYNAGNKARLVSPPFSVSLSGTVCLQFWYHMFGFGMGELNVYIIDFKGSLYKVWSDPPQHEDKWKSGSVAINGGAYNGAFQIMFEAIRGSTVQTDIALDDITITPGYCNWINRKPSGTTRTSSNTSSGTTSHCASGMFECSSRQCVAQATLCNGLFDCEDGSDEAGCPQTGGPLYYGDPYRISTGTVIGVSIASVGIIVVIVSFMFFIVMRRRTRLHHAMRRSRRLHHSSYPSDEELVRDTIDMVKPPPYTFIRDAPPSYSSEPPPYTSTLCLGDSEQFHGMVDSEPCREVSISEPNHDVVDSESCTGMVDLEPRHEVVDSNPSESPSSAHEIN